MDNPSLTPRRTPRLVLLAGLWLFAAAVVVVFHAVVLPFALAALIAYIIAPLVDWLSGIHGRRLRIPRWTAVLLVYLGFFLAVYIFLVGLVPQLYREVVRISHEAVKYANSLTPERIERAAQSAEKWLNAHGVPISLSHQALDGAEEGGGNLSLTLDLEEMVREVAAHASSVLRENLGSVLAFSKNLAFGVIAGVFGLLFILMLTAFLSIDIREVKAYLRTLIPREHADNAAELVRRIDRSLSGVVRGQLIICLVNGVLTFLGLELFHVHFAFLLSTVAAVFSLIPVFGSILSSVPIVLIAVSQSWHKGLEALAWIVGIHQLEAYFLNPKIMGTAARIHPVVMAFALIAGESAYGLVGALLAAPVAAILVACFEFAREKAQRA